MELFDLTALELGERIKKREISAPEAAHAAFDRIDKLEATYGCYITLLKDEALAQAEAVQSRLNAGESLSPLAGVPMGLKDLICTKGALTTCGSHILEGFRPPYDATIVGKLKAAGMMCLGKLNMDEFAMGSTTETSYYQTTRNPWDVSRVPGGSSGGSAAAVALGEAFYTIGSDTGGSIRQPAAFCGVTGIKPTYGAVSRFGLIAYASSLDQMGPLGRDAADCAAVLSIIAGHDPRDSTSVNRPAENYLSNLNPDIKGMKIGIPADYLAQGIDPEVKEGVLAAAKTFAELGAEVTELPMPLLEYAIPAYYIIACAEASSNLARYDGVKYGFRPTGTVDLLDLYLKSRSEGFGHEAQKRILLGSFVLSSGYYDAYYLKAQQVRALIKQSFNTAFESFDLILGPVAPTTALRFGESLNDPLKMYLGDIYTVSINLAGLPAIAAPCGFDSQGLPLGFQLIANDFREQTAFNALHAYQQATGYHRKRPGGAAPGTPA